MELRGRVALVTGGARRLGHAIALAFAERGAHVVISYRTSAREARAAAQALERLGVEALALRADVSRAAEVRRLMGRIQQRFGRLDVLVNSAANFLHTPWPRLTEQAWDRSLDANLKGPFLCALYGSRLMRHGGKIINLADWAGVRPYRDYLPYCVSKAGVIGLTKSLGKELATKGIIANALTPATFESPILEQLPQSQVDYMRSKIPMGRLGEVEESAAMVCFMASEECSFTTAATFDTSGGRTTF